MIGRRGERGSGISVLAARHDDDDDDVMPEVVSFKNELFFFRIRLALSVATSVTKAPTVGTNRKERSKKLKQK